jgi:hypothetical protein
VQTLGGSVQFSVFSGLPPTMSADTALYRNDWNSAMRYLSKPIYRPGLSWLLMSEFTFEGTSLEDPDRAESSRFQWGMAGDINLRIQYGALRLRVDAMYRSMEYLLLNQPSLVPFQDFPSGASANPELFGAIGFDYYFETIGNTVGLTLGIDRPASYSPPVGGINPLDTTAAVLVVRNQGDVVILPPGDTALPALAAKLLLQQDFLEVFAFIAQAYYQYDPNGTRLITDPVTQLKSRVFELPHRLGFNFTLQARF